MAFADTLKQKAGPLPVWAWGAIIGVLIVGATYYFRSRTAGAAATADPGSLVAYPDVEGGTGLSAGSTVTNADGSTDDDDGGFYSNSSWLAAAVAWCVGQAMNPLTVQRALQKYLDGADLTEAESNIVNIVVKRFGLPPTGTTGVSDVVTDQKIVMQDPKKDTDPVVQTPVIPPPANVALSPVGTALWNVGIKPPADAGATNSQQQADYGKAYEAQWEKMYGAKK